MARIAMLMRWQSGRGNNQGTIHENKVQMAATDAGQAIMYTHPIAIAVCERLTRQILHLERCERGKIRSPPKKAQNFRRHDLFDAEFHCRGPHNELSSSE